MRKNYLGHVWRHGLTQRLKRLIAIQVRIINLAFSIGHLQSTYIIKELVI